MLGAGLVVMDGTGRTLFIQPKAPKAKRPREIRITERQPRLLISDATANSTVWEVARDRDYVHPTQKPVELATRAIQNSSRPGDIIVDGFSGSGTLLMGCEMSRRKARVIDIDPAYVEAAIRRWQEFTGKEATLADSGQTFDQVVASRARGPSTNRKRAQARERTASRPAS